MVGAGNFYNNGILSLANSTIKTFTIGGNYYSTNTSVLNLDIRAGGSDALAISGTIVLDGTLNLTINNASTVTDMDRFDLIIGSPIAGSFSTTNLPGNLSDWDITFDANGYLVLEYNGAPLPIELLSFTGNQQNNAIQLKWETATETNNAYMAVEASKDGVHFVEIGQRKGAGTSLERHTYSFTDINPFTGINYYRLRQVDSDGKPTYHNIIAVKYEGKSKQGFNIVPTLVNTDFTLLSESPMPAGSTVQIVDTKGSVIQQLLIDAETNQKIINVAALPNGIYFATVKTGNAIQTLRFVRF